MNQDSRWLHVENPDAVAFVEDPRKISLLEPYFVEEKSISSAALEQGESFKRMYYITKKALDLGLLKLAGVQKRKGKAVKLYKAAARALFVPLCCMRESVADRRLSVEHRMLDVRLSAAAHSSPVGKRTDPGEEWGELTTFDFKRNSLCTFLNSTKHRFESAEAYYTYLLSESTTPYFSVFAQDLKLSDEDAKAFQRDLSRMYLHYLELGGKKSHGAKYFVKLFMAQQPGS